MTHKQSLKEFAKSHHSKPNECPEITLYPSEISFVVKPITGEISGTRGSSVMFGDLLNQYSARRADREFEKTVQDVVTVLHEWWYLYKQADQEEKGGNKS